MAKIVALYKRPANPQEFDERYFNKHVPLVERIPGLLRNEVSKVVGTPEGESEYYLIANLYFDSMESLQVAMASPEGQAVANDALSFAKDIIYLMFAEEAKLPAVAGA